MIGGTGHDRRMLLPHSGPPRLVGLRDELLAFALGASCAGCDERGTVLCRACLAEIAPAPLALLTPSGLPVHAALRFTGVAARCIRRLKGEGETLLAPPLGAALASVMGSVIGPVRFVPVPTMKAAFRRRGYRVPDVLIRCAGESPHRALLAARRRADQRGLTAGERARNVEGSMRAHRGGGGSPVVLVDDVVTTGSTLDEGARALRAAGYEVLSAVALADTPQHSTLTADSSTTQRK